jgi:glycine cleavage system H lipoate-binding protein
MRISASENKSKAMWDLVKVELGNQKKATKNIEISENGANIQDAKTIANGYTSIAKKILSNNPVLKTNETNVNTVKYNSNSMFLTPTTEEEVVDLINGNR